VQAGADACGRGWQHAKAGTQHFTVVNGGVGGTEVELQQPSSKRIFLDIESLGAGASVASSVTLAAGSYRFVCLAADENPAYGPAVVVPDGPIAAPLTPGIVPISRNELIGAAKAYEAWIAGRVPTLTAQVARLERDVAGRRLPAARRDWLVARRTYRTLGGAYDAFGDLGDAIDGTPAAGRTAGTDPHLEGFQRIEALLWAAHPSAAAVEPHTKRLVSAVADLRAKLPTLQVDPADVGLRAHEILENGLQLDLTGRTDAGSGTTLASLDAEVTGTEAALRPLRPILAAHNQSLTDVDRWLARTRALIDRHERHGSWTPVGALSRADRERLDATVGQTVEVLARVAVLCDPRRDL
jgi:iron uptake system component EfeO